MPALTNGDFAVYTNKMGTTIAVSYSDCVKMTQFLVLKYTSTHTQVYTVCYVII